MITQEKKDIDTNQLAFSVEEVEKIRRLLQFVDLGVFGDSLILRNKQGTARILLRKDGTIHIEGQSILTVAETDIRFNAAKIDLN